VEFLGEFKSILKNALVYESGDQLGTFGEITLDKKSHATVPLSSCWIAGVPSLSLTISQIIP
jgi:hypothetical protein